MPYTQAAIPKNMRTTCTGVGSLSTGLETTPHGNSPRTRHARLNYHMESPNPGDPLTFDYRVKAGIARHSMLWPSWRCSVSTSILNTVTTNTATEQSPSNVDDLQVLRIIRGCSVCLPWLMTEGLSKYEVPERLTCVRGPVAVVSLKRLMKEIAVCVFVRLLPRAL